MMKKTMVTMFFAGTMIAAMGFAAVSCGKNTTEEASEPVLAEAEAEEQATESEGLQEPMTYMSPNGFQIRYYPDNFESNEIDENTQSFVYMGESAGTNMVTVYYKKGVGPEEALYELTTDGWGADQEKIERSQGIFPGTDDKWGFWRTLYGTGGGGSKLVMEAIAGEYNGGTLMFEVISHMNDDEGLSMAVSDSLAFIIDSVTYDKFEDQEMFSYYPGVYTDVKDNNYSVELRDDHYGTLHFQDDVEILWGSDYIITTSGQSTYEMNIEGDSLYLRNYDDPNGDFREYSKGEITVADDGNATPAFEYKSDDVKDKAVYDYMSNEIGKLYPETDVKIPLCRLVDIDMSDENDVKVYGEFWVYGYNRDGDTLICENGGQHVGCMHLEKGEGLTYTVKEFDQAKDGSSFVSSAKEIFGDRYSTLEKIMGDIEDREATRAEIIRNYVTDNNLSITKYQDHGWMPENLFE